MISEKKKGLKKGNRITNGSKWTDGFYHIHARHDPERKQAGCCLLVLILLLAAGMMGCAGIGAISREVESNMHENLFIRPYSPSRGSSLTPKPFATPKPKATPKPAQSRSGTKEKDPYDASDYSHADDFYYDHYDDFWDYEDAEDYWEEYGD